MKKILTSFVVGAALLIPGTISAQPQRHDDRDDHRYYDKKHKDYHEWNDHESRAYRIYWQQHHRNYVDWERASERQRNDYWNWRHSHSDAILNINIR